MEIWMSGWAGLSESIRLARTRREELLERLPARFLDEMDGLAAFACADAGGPGIPIGRGGVYESLWRLADGAQEALGIPHLGVTADRERIPVRQETIEVCERLDLDPCAIPSGGRLFLVSGDLTREHRGELFGERERPEGARCIGYLTRGKDRIIREREGVRYLARPSAQGGGAERTDDGAIGQEG